MLDHPPTALLTNNEANLIPTPNVQNFNSNWFPDFDASFHVTGDSQDIHQNVPYEDPEQIRIGNNQGLPIQSSRSSYFSDPNNPNISSVLHHLLHVINKNLISLSKFVKNNSIYFESHATPCFVKSQVTN